MSDGRHDEPNPPVPAGWVAVGGAIEKVFRFRDFDEAWDFMARVADVARRRDHHPDWSNSWSTVTISLTSHDVGRLTSRDTSMAAEIDALAGS